MTFLLNLWFWFWLAQHLGMTQNTWWTVPYFFTAIFVIVVMQLVEIFLYIDCYESYQERNKKS